MSDSGKHPAAQEPTPHFPPRAQFLSHSYCGAFIDDTGTPGQVSASPFLHPQRKTWVALVLDAELLTTVYEEFPGALDEIRRRFGVTEFHATDLSRGRGALSVVPLGQRLAVFEFLAFIFARHRFPLLISTISPADIAAHKHVFVRLGTAGPFDYTSHGDAGLLFLIEAVGKYVKSALTPSTPMLLVADEGRMKSGTFVRLPELADFAEGSGIFFRTSKSTFPLQLADFAAFAINRMHWLLAKSSLSNRDKTELGILGRANFQVVNADKLWINPNVWRSGDYDRLVGNLARFRKRLPDNPRK